jgi:thymidine phosphorylase
VAPVVQQVVAPRAGVVTTVDALAVGIAALELGAGRRTKADAIDHAVGVVCRTKRGDSVETGDVLAEIHAADEGSAAAGAEAVLAAYTIGDSSARRPDVVLAVLQ